MNARRWDAIAEAFARGEFVPANGMEAWNEQAVSEAVAIRAALPRGVETLLEVGCGVGRLTPFLAVMFPRVVATDTSAACRLVTRKRCRYLPNVRVEHPNGQSADAAVIWGHLYDEDWTREQALEHFAGIIAWCPIVLLQP